MNKTLKLAVKVAVSLCFAGYLAFKVDWVGVAVAFRQVSPGLYALSTVIALASSLFVALKYYLLIRGSVIDCSLLALLKINFISRFYSLFLPSALGVEAVRWLKVTRNRNGRVFFMACTAFERLTFLLMLHIFGLIPLFLYSAPGIIGLRSRILPMLAMTLVLICLGITYLLFSRVQALFERVVKVVLPSGRLTSRILLFFQNLSLGRPTMEMNLFGSIVGLSLLWQIFFVARLFLLFCSAGLPLGPVDVAWMGSLVLLLQVIPVSFAGLGIREGAYAYLFTLFKLGPEKGVLIGVLFFSQMLIFAGIGGLLEIADKS